MQFGGIYLSAALLAVALFALARWRSEWRAARLREIIDSRLAGKITESQRERDGEDELALPYFRRVVLPALRASQERLARRMTPANFHDEWEQKLRLAGVAQSPESFFFGRLALSCTALIATLTLAFMLPRLSLDERILFPLVVAAVVFLYPSIRLNSRAQRRMAAIDRELPEVFDLLSVSVEAGLAFDGALRKVVGSLSGPARDEFSRALADIQLGIPRAEALTSLARRTKSPPLKRFAGLVAQSDRTGAAIGPALQVQARDIKAYRAAKAREKAASIPIKIIIPMVIFIFPAMFVIILGPAVISVLRTFHL